MEWITSLAGTSITRIAGRAARAPIMPAHLTGDLIFLWEEQLLKRTQALKQLLNLSVNLLGVATEYMVGELCNDA